MKFGHSSALHQDVQGKKLGHLVAFKGRNYSGAVEQNLLWQDGNVYLMDNHRAALWCWQQQLDLASDKHSLIHIDRHYDALSANLDAHLNVMPSLNQISIDQYLSAIVRLADHEFPLFRWDNYLSLYLEAFRTNLAAFRCLTHGDGDKPASLGMFESQPHELPGNLEFWLKGRWIVNIDLDYFFCDGDHDDCIQLFSDQFIEHTFSQLRRALDAEQIAVITICLTPSNFTPGWEACIELSERIFHLLGRTHPKI